MKITDITTVQEARQYIKQFMSLYQYGIEARHHVSHGDKALLVCLNYIERSKRFLKPFGLTVQIIPEDEAAENIRKNAVHNKELLDKEREKVKALQKILSDNGLNDDN